MSQRRKTYLGDPYWPAGWRKLIGPAFWIAFAGVLALIAHLQGDF